MISDTLHYRDQVKARGVTAADLMTTAVVAVRPDDTVGIISRADVLSVFDRTDKDIRRETSAGRSPTRFSSVSS